MGDKTKIFLQGLIHGPFAGVAYRAYVLYCQHKARKAAQQKMHLMGGTSRQNGDKASDELSDKAVGSPTRK